MNEKVVDIEKAMFCKRKILERLKNHALLAAAREKRRRRAEKRAAPKQRKFIGTVIDINPWHCEFVPATERTGT